MGYATILLATVLGVAIGLLLVTVEETVRRRAGGLRFQHELRRGAFARWVGRSASAPVLQPVPVRVRERQSAHRHAA